MKKVFRLDNRKVGDRVHTCLRAPKPTTIASAAPDPAMHQAAIENALTMALYFLRLPGDSTANLWAATARANRALTLLKQASQGNGTPTTANATRRG